MAMVVFFADTGIAIWAFSNKHWYDQSDLINPDFRAAEQHKRFV